MQESEAEDLKSNSVNNYDIKREIMCVRDCLHMCAPGLVGARVYACMCLCVFARGEI